MPLPSGLPESIDDGEEVIRYLTSSNDFNGQVVRPHAFQPTSQGKKSVVRRSGSPLSSIWEWPREFLPNTRIHGAAVLLAARVRAAGLDVTASEPPPRHANIVGWPVSDSGAGIRKAESLQAQQLLASASSRLMAID